MNDLLYFPVEKVAVEDFGFTGIAGATHHIVSGNTLIQTCSDRYNLIKNIDLYPEIESALDANQIKWEKSIVVEEKARFTVTYTLPDYYIVAESGETIFYTIRVTNSYNNSARLSAYGGAFRLICKNGMTIGQVDFRVVAKHTEKAEINLDLFKVHLQNIPEYLKNVKKIVRVLGDRMVEDWNARLIEVLNATGVKDTEKTMDMVEECVLREITRLNTNDVVTDWMLYNAINEGFVFNDEANSVHEHKRYHLDAQIANYMVKHEPVLN